MSYYGDLFDTNGGAVYNGPAQTTIDLAKADALAQVATHSTATRWAVLDDNGATKSEGQTGSLPMGGGATPPAATATLSISDCVTNKIGTITADGSQLQLKHDGDTATLFCPPQASSVTFQVRHTLKTHTVGDVWPNIAGPTVETSDQSTITLKTGETHVISPIREGKMGDAVPLTLTHTFTDDEDKIITLTSWLDLNGKAGGINTTGYTFTWDCTMLDGTVLGSGTEPSLEAAKTDIDAIDKGNPSKPFTATVLDGTGGVVYTRDYNQPTGSDLTPIYWLIGGIVAAVVIIAVMYLLLKRRAGVTPSVGTAPAPVPAATPVVVVK